MFTVDCAKVDRIEIDCLGRDLHPLLTFHTHNVLAAALDSASEGAAVIRCSLNLGKSTTTVTVERDGWTWNGQLYPWLATCKERTIYHWTGQEFAPASRYTSALIKLVPTEWGPPTFEIDGIKMLPTAQVSPYEDAGRKVALIEPRDKIILDTCGGLGYFADWCLKGGAQRVLSYEKNADVLWLRTLNPWSPAQAEALVITHADIAVEIGRLPTATMDAVLHDPPRFGIAGELYSQAFYDHLARVLKSRGRLFHYTGTPNRLTTGRDVPREVATRLQRAGFRTRLHGDGVIATKT